MKGTIDTDEIAHLPLDVPYFEFDKGLYDEMLMHDTLLQTGDSRSSYVWGRKEVVLFGRGKTQDDFFNVTTTTESWYDRYELGPREDYIINPVFSKRLTNEIQKMLDFIELNIPIFPAHLTLVNSTTDVPMHCDVPPEQVNCFFNKGAEPANVKILLNPEQYDNTLFFQKYGTDKKSTKPQIKILNSKRNIPENVNVFGWSENFHGHGAKQKENTNRMLINIFGPLDKEKYKELVRRSLEKYSDYAITFDLNMNTSWDWNNG